MARGQLGYFLAKAMMLAVFAVIIGAVGGAAAGVVAFGFLILTT